MSEMTNQNLSSVAETLLIPLYIRVIASQRPDALFKDDKAVALVRQMEYDFSRIKQLKSRCDQMGSMPNQKWINRTIG